MYQGVNDMWYHNETLNHHVRRHNSTEFSILGVKLVRRFPLLVKFHVLFVGT